MPQEDPEAYAWLVTIHIEAKMEELKYWAKRASLENLPDLYAEADRLYRHLSILKKTYSGYLGSNNVIKTAI